MRSINSLSGARDPRYEVHLVGVADELIEVLQTGFGERAPAEALRVEWVGPKAGQQLRDAAIQSLLYAIAFIMLYVAFRFDLRFAPGGVIAMLHDALITLGIYVLLQKEVNLTTVAALLTIMGYSINDTIVVFDRIRENRQRYLYLLVGFGFLVVGTLVGMQWFLDGLRAGYPYLVLLGAGIIAGTSWSKARTI